MEIKIKKIARGSLLKEVEKVKGRCRLITVTCVDHGGFFEIVYHFFHKGKILNYCVLLNKGEDIDSISSIFPSAAFYEREIHDLFGIKFRNHPKLEKLFLPDDWGSNEGYPLRKS